ncbi:MAG: hypothetical protein P8130_15575 [Deltaproteobacteria bacterium]
MKRAHAFEFEDLQWFPAHIRNYGTEYFQFVANLSDFYKNILPVIRKGIEKSGCHHVIDIGSGGGGGWVKLAERLQKDIPDLRVTLTDLYPNRNAFEAMVRKNPRVFSFETEPVSALNVPARLTGLRTQFLSFHHFRPKEAQQILQNAVDRRVPIALFEAQAREIIYLIRFTLAPLVVLFLTPFIRPFRLGRLLFTYIIPIVPLFVLWDALVSVLRTYRIPEMEEMTHGLEDGDLYEWEIGKRKNGPTTILYLLGYPKDNK